MKKLILTSKLFEGEIHVLYFENKLAMIDLQHATLSDTQIDFFKKRVPIVFVSIEEFTKVFEAKSLIVIEEGYCVGFEEFWTAYGQKRNRDRVIKLWQKMSVSEQVQAFLGIKPYKAFLKREEWRTQKEPDTYLRERAWLNDWK